MINYLLVRFACRIQDLRVMYKAKFGVFTLVFILFQLVNSFVSLGQKYEIGFGFGALNYKGDLAPNVKIQNTRPGVNVFFKINFSNAVSLRTGLMLGYLSGNDIYQSDPFLQQRNFGFNSLLSEANSVIEYHFFDFRRDSRRLKYSPYIFAGLGLSANFLTETTGNAPPPSGNVLQAAVPFGVGVKKIVNDRISLGLEFSTTKTFSDNTDLINDLNIGPRNGRVSRSDLDNYYYLNFTISYRFLQLLCPKHFDIKK